MLSLYLVNLLTARQILVTTGGESWLSESVQSAWFSCDALDVIAIHAYGPGDLETSAISPYVTQAQNAGKKLLFEEWFVFEVFFERFAYSDSYRGACYYDTENNNCPTGDMLDTATRNGNIQNWASQITGAGVPWLYWQVLPNADPHVRLFPTCRCHSSQTYASNSSDPTLRLV